MVMKERSPPDSVFRSWCAALAPSHLHPDGQLARLMVHLNEACPSRVSSGSCTLVQA